MIKGIGPIYARKLVRAFSETVFDIIEQTPERLQEVDGIGPKRAKSIVTAWAGQKAIREIMIFSRPRRRHVTGGAHARPGQPAATAKQVDPMLGEPTLLAGGGVVRNHVVAPGNGRLDVDLRCRRRFVCAVHGLSRAQQRLRRDARPKGTLATDQLVLDQCDAQSAICERSGAVLAGEPPPMTMTS